MSARVGRREFVYDDVSESMCHVEGQAWNSAATLVAARGPITEPFGTYSIEVLPIGVTCRLQE